MPHTDSAPAADTPCAMPVADLNARIAVVWRTESGKVVAKLTRMLHDVGQAEEIAQDALVTALEHWPTHGMPDNPGAWLMTTAKNRALDRLRHWAMQARKHEAMGHELAALQADVVPDFVDAIDAARADDIGDDLLRLIFIACHPVLSTEARVALTLRLLGGLSTADIARAYLTPEPTIAQRIVRAKRSLSAARVPFEVPNPAERAQRLDSVLEVIYLIFNEGYAASSGDDWMRPALCEDALRLGRVLVTLMPNEAEVHALLALMELQASRTLARANTDGQAIKLSDQDRSLWDPAQVARGLAALARSDALATPRGPYALQAALAACHARAPNMADTDWHQIVALYDALAALTPSPVIELNRAVAVGMAFGPQAALDIVEVLKRDSQLADYPWLDAVRGDLLEKLGRPTEARSAFEQAAALTRNQRERTMLMHRARVIPAAPDGNGRAR